MLCKYSFFDGQNLYSLCIILLFSTFILINFICLTKTHEWLKKINIHLILLIPVLSFCFVLSSCIHLLIDEIHFLFETIYFECKGSKYVKFRGFPKLKYPHIDLIPDYCIYNLMKNQIDFKVSKIDRLV